MTRKNKVTDNVIPFPTMPKDETPEMAALYNRYNIESFLWQTRLGMLEEALLERSIPPIFIEVMIGDLIYLLERYDEYENNNNYEDD